MKQEMEDLLALYALGALEEDERARVERYVAGDAAARQRLDELLRAAEELPYAAPPLTPSPALKRKVLESVRADSGRTAPAGWLPRLWAQPANALAALALVAAIAALAWGLAANRQVAGLRAELDADQAQSASQQAALGLLADEDSRLFRVPATDAGEAASALFVVGADGEQFALIANGLQPLDQELVYQVWLIAGETPVSGGVFEVGAGGAGILLVSASELDSTQFELIGVSIEPAGGSPAPTGAIVLLGAEPITEADSTF